VAAPWLHFICFGEYTLGKDIERAFWRATLLAIAAIVTLMGVITLIGTYLAM